MQTSPISFVARGNGTFPRATKERGDVCTQASFRFPYVVLNSLLSPTGAMNFYLFSHRRASLSLSNSLGLFYWTIFLNVLLGARSLRLT